MGFSFYFPYAGYAITSYIDIRKNPRVGNLIKTKPKKGGMLCGG